MGVSLETSKVSKTFEVLGVEVLGKPAVRNDENRIMDKEK
jgi:hypothetical protein